MKRPAARDTFHWQRNTSYSFEFGDVGAENSLRIEIPPATLRDTNSTYVDNENVTVYLACHPVNVNVAEELENAPQLIAKVDKIEGSYVDRSNVTKMNLFQIIYFHPL